MATKETRYLLSAGYAFAEEQEMDKLGRLAAEGWLLEGFAFLGYWLRKGEPQQLVYSLDVQDVREGEREEYLQMFRAGGWLPVCFNGKLHIFSSAPGTLPIYSDKTSLREKYIQTYSFSKWACLILWVMFAAGVALRTYVDWEQYSMIYWNLLAVGHPLLLIFAVPSLMVFVALHFRLRRLK